MQRPWNRPPLRLYRPRPRLTFAPLAWLKVQFFCHAGDTEIGGFGLAAPDNLLYVEDFITVRQRVTAVTVRFDDDAVADFFDRAVDQGLAPNRFARIWCHTHPGASVTPSHTDEETFARSFGHCDWAVMFILGRTSNTYARLAFNAGPGAQLEVPVAVDWSAWPACLAAQNKRLEEEAGRWQEEYAAHLQPLPAPVDPFAGLPVVARPAADDGWEPYGWCPELDGFTYEPAEEDLDHEPDPRPRAS